MYGSTAISYISPPVQDMETSIFYITREQIVYAQSGLPLPSLYD